MENMHKPTNDIMAKAATLIQEGKLIAFPTETVYGLGADATNDSAIAAIFKAKGRPKFNPLISHIADVSDAKHYVEWSNEAEKLATAFWPGPLTMVLPRKENSPISLLASAGLDTIAIRFPAHPVAQELIKQAGRPIAAPSANASGSISPTLAAHVAQSLGSNVDMILDGGAAEVGLESTVISLAHEVPTILRHGGVTRDDLAPHLSSLQESLHNDSAPKSPGMLLSHYAPRIPVRLNADHVKDDEALLAFGDDSMIKGGAQRLNLSRDGNLVEAAANLFAMMRELDQDGLSGIAVMTIPKEGLGIAMNDRLNRAAIADR